MERINVGEAFRVCKSNCNFKMEFNAKVDMRRAYEAIAAVVNEISD